MEGVLKKQGEKGLFKLWKTRYFKEQDGKLYYYKNKNDAAPKGFIDISTIISVQPKDNNYGFFNEFGIEVKSTNRIYCLVAATETEQLNWINGLMARLNQNKKYVPLEDDWKNALKLSNRSVKVKIVNDTDKALIRRHIKLHGTFQIWRQFPAEKILPKSSIECGTASSAFIGGTSASVVYGGEDDSWGEITLRWQNPYRKITASKQATSSGTGRYDAQVEDDKSECSPFVLLPDHWSVTFTIRASRDAKDSPVVNKALPSPSVSSKNILDDVYHTDWVRKLKKALKSVLVTVINNTSTVLERVESENRHGLWRQLPPEKIDKSTTVRFGTESTGLAGTEGKVLFVAPSAEEEGGETVISLYWTNNMFTVNFGHELTTNLKKPAMKMQVLPVKKDSGAEIVFVLEDDTSKPLKVDTTPTSIPEKESKSANKKVKREPQQEGFSNSLTASFKEMRTRRPTDSSRDVEKATVRWESVSYHLITHHKNTSGVSLFFNKLVGDGDMLIETGIDLPPREKIDACQVCQTPFKKEKEKAYCQLCGSVIHINGPCHIDMPLQDKYLDDMKELNKNLMIHCCVKCEALIEAGVALQQWKIERKKHEKLAALLAKISRGSRALKQCSSNGDKIALKECILTVEADLNQLKNTKVEGETWETFKNNIIRTLNEYLLLCKSTL
jgi:hypothetical protein